MEMDVLVNRIGRFLNTQLCSQNIECLTGRNKFLFRNGDSNLRDFKDEDALIYVGETVGSQSAPLRILIP